MSLRSSSIFDSPSGNKCKYYNEGRCKINDCVKECKNTPIFCNFYKTYEQRNLKNSPKIVPSDFMSEVIGCLNGIHLNVTTISKDELYTNITARHEAFKSIMTDFVPYQIKLGVYLRNSYYSDYYAYVYRLCKACNDLVGVVDYVYNSDPKITTVILEEMRGYFKTISGIQSLTEKFAIPSEQQEEVNLYLSVSKEDILKVSEQLFSNSTNDRVKDILLDYIDCVRRDDLWFVGDLKSLLNCIHSCVVYLAQDDFDYSSLKVSEIPLSKACVFETSEGKCFTLLVVDKDNVYVYYFGNDYKMHKAQFIEEALEKVKC